MDAKLSELPARSSYDEVVAFIDEMLDEAMPGLVEAHNPMYFGRATKHVARALRSRVHLYAASPLFNGNSEFYSNFVDENGKHLISQTYDVKKWEKCAEVTLDAIQNAEKAGYKLYGDVEAELQPKRNRDSQTRPKAEKLSAESDIVRLTTRTYVKSSGEIIEANQHTVYKFVRR